MASTIELRPESEQARRSCGGPSLGRADLAIHREVLRDPKNYGAEPSYKPLFERAVREFGDRLH